MLNEQQIQQKRENDKTQFDAEQQDKDPDFLNSKSSASCYISEINHILYGGISFRFWMLRKHFNSLMREDLEDLPFYSWQCLTLVLQRREVNLVIPDKDQLEMLLKFLIHKMRTLNGSKGTANKILRLLNERAIATYKKQQQKRVISESTKHWLISINEQSLFRKVYLKYLIMRVRQKISFMAL